MPTILWCCATVRRMTVKISYLIKVSISSVRPRNDELTFSVQARAYNQKTPRCFRRSSMVLAWSNGTASTSISFRNAPEPGMFRGPYSSKLAKAGDLVIWSSRQYSDHGARDQQELKRNGLVVVPHGSPGTGDGNTFLKRLYQLTWI